MRRGVVRFRGVGCDPVDLTLNLCFTLLHHSYGVRPLHWLVHKGAILINFLAFQIMGMQLRGKGKNIALP